ncbi:MAG: hypothetical protein IJA32_12635 [Lachnospiraceae bacterium]|nr:hypothetical protein [Lachnospiraceae bacterium]
MTEAEVILRLAMYYIRNDYTKENVTVSIDGAHVKTGNMVHFNIFTFLKENGFQKIDNESERWQGEYFLVGSESRVIISSTPGNGDVNVKLTDGRIVYAECKKGKNDKRGQEYSLMREAIGQLMTGCDFTKGVIPIVAVPYTDKSKELAERWSKLTQIKNLGIKFALVCEDGEINFV